MKKFTKITAMMLALLTMCVTFTACGDDDDDKQATVAAADIVAGSYNDDMTCTVMGSTDTYEDVDFTLTKVTDGTVNIVLPGFGTPPMQLPSITLEGVKVTGSDGTATIAEQVFSGKIVNASGAEKAYTCTISGSYANGKLTLNYSLQYGNMPMAMVCKFEGTKK